MNKRAQLVQAIAAASTFHEQARLVAALAEYDRRRVAAAQQDREWDAAGAIVEQTLSPVAVHEHHTVATDWIGDIDTSGANYHQEMCAEASVWYGGVHPMVKADATELAEQARGMARRTAGKYGESAQAAAQTFLDYVAFLHSKTAASGLDQIDQERDPKDDPKATPLPTEVFDTFQPPVHPVNEGVDGPRTGSPLIDEVESYGAPYGNGPEKPGGHSTTMDESGSYAEVPLGPPGQIPTEEYKTSALIDPPTLAIGYTMNMDDYRAQMAAQARREGGAAPFVSEGVGPDTTGWSYLDDREEDTRQPEDDARRQAYAEDEEGEWYPEAGPLDSREDDARRQAYSMKKGAPFAGYKDFAACVAANQDKDDPEAYCGSIKHKVEDGKKEGASTLPVQHQVIDPNNTPTPEADTFNTEVAFPLNPAFAKEPTTEELPAAENVAQAKRREFVAGLLARAPQTWTPVERAEVADYLSKAAGLSKQADMFSAPHNVPGGETPVGNSADTTPQPASGAYSKGKADGEADRAAGEAPTFSDASSHASDYVKGYSEGYGGAQSPAGDPDVPASMGGDNGQAAQVAQASKTAGKIDSPWRGLVREASVQHPDFVKGWGYARKWRPGVRLVSTGSAEFEEGLYAGITENPRCQAAWVVAHRKAARALKRPELIKRISNHERATRRFARSHPATLVRGFYVQAATSTDLFTMGPGASPDPMGSTPINGPGTPPPMAGGMDPARPGGPAMYNAAPPYGQGPVAPDPVVGGQQTSSPVTEGNALPGYPSAEQRQAAFRTLVQANLGKKEN